MRPLPRAGGRPLRRPLYRIGAVARMSGISEHTLRVWERRYGRPRPVRTEGGTRLYSPQDVERLRSIKRLLEAGHAIGDVVRLPAGHLRRLAEGGPAQEGLRAAAAAAVRERFLDALRSLDVEGARSALAHATCLFDPRELVTAVVAPLLVTIGERWADQTFCMAQEHAASAIVRTQLGTLLAMHAPAGPAEVAVCATPEGERHEFGALFAALFVAVRGWQPVYLGASLPPAEIALAARQRKAALVLVSVVSLDAREAQRQLRELASLLPARTRLVAGGRGLPPRLELPARVQVATRLERIGL